MTRNALPVKNLDPRKIYLAVRKSERGNLEAYDIATGRVVTGVFSISAKSTPGDLNTIELGVYELVPAIEEQAA